VSIETSRFAKVAALALFAGSALLQGAEQGTFHLPFQARWGEAILEPGDYKMTMPASPVGNSTFAVTTVGKTVFELPATVEYAQFSDCSKLTLTNVNGQYVVTEVSFGSAGKTYGFHVPKSMRKLAPVTSADKLALEIR
jgi:hypothetical protein